MSGLVLSRNDVQGTGRDQTSDFEAELHRLETLLLPDGEDNFIDSYFRFLSFFTKNARQLRHVLTTAFLKFHCVRLFKAYCSNKERFGNDARFVQCMMWFGLYQPRIYKDVIEKGIGDQCAVTFVMYAKSLAKQGDIAGAVNTINKGLDMQALPIAYLEDTLRDLQGGDSSTVQENTAVIDPHSRFVAEARDFDPKQVRSYDFRAVYPECNPEEFQFEERRLQRWLERKKSEDELKAIQNILKEKDSIIERLRETIADLQRKIEILRANKKRSDENNVTAGNRQRTITAATGTDVPLPPVVLKEQSVFNDNQDPNICDASTKDQKPSFDRPPIGEQANEELVEAVWRPEEELTSQVKKNAQGESSCRGESTIMMNNRTEMMTRDIREFCWNGSFNSTNVGLGDEAITSPLVNEQSVTCDADVGRNVLLPLHSKREQNRLIIFEENPTASCPQSRTSGADKITVSCENDGRFKRKSGPDIVAPAKRFAVCVDENQMRPYPKQDVPRQPKLKVFNENPEPPVKDEKIPNESEESAIPSASDRDVQIIDEDLPLDPSEEPIQQSCGRFTASTPTRNTPNKHEVTWRVTEVLRGIMLPPMGLSEGNGVKIASPAEDNAKQTMQATVRHLSTIFEASKESGSSTSSQSLGTPSLARASSAVSSCDDTIKDSELNPILSDPFNLAHRNKVILGSKIDYETVTGNLPQMRKKTRIQYPGGYRATIMKMIGEGGFAKVYFAQRELDDDEVEEGPNEPTTCIVRDDQAAIKITKEIIAGLWEYYILRVVSSRLTRQNHEPCIRKSIPEPHCAAYYQDGFLISLPFLPYGSLLDLVNSFEKAVPEELARYFVLELMIIIMRLHETGIIHCDLKPDNVLFRKVPTMNMVNELRRKTQCICLIDFGQSIDMKTFPSETTFSYVMQRESQRCVAMREGRDWLYDIDWFGVANCAHTLLFGDYIDIEKKPSGDYGIKRRIPRYWANDWWSELFSTLLNINATTAQPGHPDNPIRKIIELGGDTLCNKKSATSLSLKLIQLNTMMLSKKRKTLV